MRTLFLAPLTFALAFTLPQDPKGQEPPPPHRAGFEGADAEAARFRTEILGAWQLTHGEIPAVGASGPGVAGYALFMDGYMSIEIHVQSGTPDNQESYFQSGTMRWKIDDSSVLQTYSLIGTHNTADADEYDFEDPGERREYKVRLNGEQLILEKPDRTARFTFMRLGKLRFPDGKESPGVDFYGRPIKPKGDKPKPKGG